MRGTHELRETLRKLARGGIGIIMVTHHLPDIIPEMRRVVTIRAAAFMATGRKTGPDEWALSNLFGGAVEPPERGGYFQRL